MSATDAETHQAPEPPVLEVPALALVVLVGASGSGKSTFAARCFGRFETVSSDTCRGVVSDDENDQGATAAAFALLNHIAGVRLDAGRLTVVDATSTQQSARAELVALARAHDVLPVAIVLDVPEAVCVARNAARPDRGFGAHVVARQTSQLKRSLKGLKREGFRVVHVLRGAEQVETASVVRVPLRTDRTDLSGPFDVVGDVHGCRAELEELLARLGYDLVRDGAGRPVDAVPPAGRRAVFLGDLVDRGPDTPGVLRLVMGMVAADHALAVPGNHEHKLVRALDGRDVARTHGLGTTMAQLAQEDEAFVTAVREFCRSLVSHLTLDGGRLVVAHAGLKEAYQGRSSGRVRAFALYGDTTGESDEYGLPVRYPWAQDYRGSATVLYGHTPTPEPEWVNNTLCLDTGCVFGGRLSALRWPEREVVAVDAHQVWSEPVRPLRPPAPQRPDGVLVLSDVLGRRAITTTHGGVVTVAQEQAAGALEVMSRFALPPAHLLHLPPTMAPAPTSHREGWLEHPEEAFAAYAADGVEEVVCEEKHMGSRAVVLVRRDPHAPTGSGDGRGTAPGVGPGAVHTRTGRSFFGADLTAALLDRVRAAVGAAGLWERLGTDWLLVDAELLPWSAKAEGLVRERYAALGAAARAALPAALDVIGAAAARGTDVGALRTRTAARLGNAEAFTDAYRRYVAPTDGLDGVTLAPFAVLASAGTSHAGRDHAWHLGVADALVAVDPTLFTPTRRLVVHTGEKASTAEGTAWWEGLTADGGEGMVVKPLAGLLTTRERRGGTRALVQPGLKVRGREYLRLVYGPDYADPASLERLRGRRLGRKRAMAQREHALGLEAVERVVAGEPLWRVHEAVFAVLAAESEPVDPRL